MKTMTPTYAERAGVIIIIISVIEKIPKLIWIIFFQYCPTLKSPHHLAQQSQACLTISQYISS